MKSLPDSVSRAAQLAGDKTVKIYNGGRAFQVVEKPEEEVAKPSEAEIVLAMLQREQVRDRESIEQIRNAVDGLKEAFDSFTAALNRLAEAQQEINKSVEELSLTMKLPVKAIHQNGKVIGAQRVDKL